jgi:hypothetical protein
MDIIAMVTAVGDATSKVFAWALERSGLKNAPDIKERKETQAALDQKAEFDKALKDRDLARIRRELSE